MERRVSRDVGSLVRRCWRGRAGAGEQVQVQRMRCRRGGGVGAPGGRLTGWTQGQLASTVPWSENHIGLDNSLVSKTIWSLSILAFLVCKDVCAKYLPCRMVHESYQHLAHLKRHQRRHTEGSGPHTSV